MIFIHDSLRPLKVFYQDGSESIEYAVARIEIHGDTVTFCQAGGASIGTNKVNKIVPIPIPKQLEKESNPMVIFYVHKNKKNENYRIISTEIANIQITKEADNLIDPDKATTLKVIYQLKNGRQVDSYLCALTPSNAVQRYLERQQELLKQLLTEMEEKNEYSNS